LTAALRALCLALGLLLLGGTQGCAAAQSAALDPATAAGMADANREAARGLNAASRTLEGAYEGALVAAVAPCKAAQPDAWPAAADCATKAAAPVDARYAPAAAAINALVAVQHRVADAVEAYVGCLKKADAVCAAKALAVYARAWADVAPKVGGASK
jgi:hypothetical protein